jgi:transposase
MQKHVVGIDVSKKKLDICAIFDDKIIKRVVENNESGFKNLIDLFKKLGVVDPHICMEATGCYSTGSAEFLHSHGYKISIANPVQTKTMRKGKLVRQKTDSSDAQIIATFCLQENPRLWHPKPTKNHELHEIKVRIDSLKTRLNQLINALENQHLSEIVKNSIDTEMKQIKEQIKTLENEVKKIIKEDKKLKDQFDLLTSIKGVGEKTSLMILADMQDVSNFKSAKQYAAFTGVTPSHFQSGTSVNGVSHISKIG